MCDEIVKSETVETIGFVYIVEDLERNLLKIGSSRSHQRPYAVAVASGVRDYTIWLSPRVHDHRTLERETHEYFDNKRVQREWFSVSKDEAISFIEQEMRICSDAEWEQAKKNTKIAAERFKNGMIRLLAQLPKDCDESIIMYKSWEASLYRFILTSDIPSSDDLPGSEEVRAWLCNDVIPSLRQGGLYFLHKGNRFARLLRALEKMLREKFESQQTEKV